MVTAQIINVTKEGTGLRVFARFSDGDETGFLFPDDTSIDDIKNQVEQARKTRDNLDTKVEQISKKLIGITLPE